MNFQCVPCRQSFESRSRLEEHRRFDHKPDQGSSLLFAPPIGSTVRRTGGGQPLGAVTAAILKSNQLLVQTPQGLVVAFDFDDVEEVSDVPSVSSTIGLDDRDIERIRKLIVSGFTDTAASDVSGFNPKTIRKYRERLGLPKNTNRGRSSKAVSA